MGDILPAKRDIDKKSKTKYLDMDLNIFLPEILFFPENSGDSCSNTNSAPSSPLEVSHKLFFLGNN